MPKNNITKKEYDEATSMSPCPYTGEMIPTQTGPESSFDVMLEAAKEMMGDTKGMPTGTELMRAMQMLKNISEGDKKK